MCAPNRIPTLYGLFSSPCSLSFMLFSWHFSFSFSFALVLSSYLLYQVDFVQFFRLQEWALYPRTYSWGQRSRVSPNQTPSPGWTWIQSWNWSQNACVGICCSYISIYWHWRLLFRDGKRYHFISFYLFVRLKVHRRTHKQALHKKQTNRQ